jgi:hypothetical protein
MSGLRAGRRAAGALPDTDDDDDDYVADGEHSDSDGAELDWQEADKGRPRKRQRAGALLSYCSWQ